MSLRNFLFKNYDKYLTYRYYFKNHIIYEFVPFFDFLLVNAEWAKSLPHDVDCIVGIPRLGLITGAIVSISLGKPLTTVERLIQHKDLNDKVISFKKILLVDDSISTGKTIKKSREEIKNNFPQVEVILAAPYVSTKATEITKHWRVVGDEMFFESDLTEHPRDDIGCDIDGVLCEEITPDVKNLDDFYKTAKTLFIPKYKLKFIASGRFEQYRKVTEEWLKKNGIEYENLILRNKEKSAIEVKVNAIRKFKPFLFYESLIIESEQIYMRTGCRILCFENKFLYGGKNNGIQE